MPRTNHYMHPRGFRVTATSDQQWVAAQRLLDLERIAKKLGRQDIWTSELQAVEEENRQVDKHLARGNYPIRDEYMLLAEYGANALRMGGYAI